MLVKLGLPVKGKPGLKSFSSLEQYWKCNLSQAGFSKVQGGWPWPHFSLAAWVPLGPTPQLHPACVWKIVTNRGRVCPGKQQGFGFINLIFLLCQFSMVISSWKGQRSCEHSTESLCPSTQFCLLLAPQRDVSTHQCFGILLELLTVCSCYTLGRNHTSDTQYHSLPWLQICSAVLLW